MALNIWKELEQNISLRSWRLDIIGEGEDFDLIKNLIVKLQLQRVNMVGYVVPNNNLYAFKDKAEYLMSNYDTIYQIANAAVMNSRKYTPVSLIDKWMGLFHDLSIDIK